MPTKEISSRSRGTWVRNLPRAERVVTACKCIVLPEVIAVLDPKEAQCRKHGWQRIERKATYPEILQGVLDIPLYTADSDIPPF